jgi:alpha-L-fucosidase 2
MDNFAYAMHRYTTKSLFSICSNAMQVDGSFGMAAAVAEMILQSHEDELAFLPALPVSWRDGEARGLLARGGFEVGLRWKAGRLDGATILSKNGTLCRVRASVPLRVLSRGKIISTTRPGPELLEFNTVPGGLYVLAPEK